MIVSLHVATGGAVGAAAGSRLGALLLGPLAHALGDLTPHQDIPSTRFEAASGAVAFLLIARGRGAFSPAAIGALAASIPDVEHVLPGGRPDSRKLFPTHRYAGLHRRGGLPTWLQLVAAAAIVVALTRSPRPPAS